MIRSMTGFGRAQVAGEKVVVSVEARSVNHRHLDVALKLPRTLASLESDARQLVQARLERGRVDVNVSVAPTPGEGTQELLLDVVLARSYLDVARRLGGELGMPGVPTLEWLLERPGVIRAEEREPLSAELLWPLLEATLRQALAELIERREAEGEALAAALRDLHEALVSEVDRMRARDPRAATRRQQRLHERLEALLAGHPFDETRVLTEIAIWAERTDVSEELTRLGAHLEQMALLLKGGGAVGRPLDFLIQEMNREINTIASKADDLELSQSAIAAKGLLEKVREQAQNLE